MSSVGVKKAARTYSRQRKRSLYDDELPTKRRRVERTETTSKENGNDENAISRPTGLSPLRDAPTAPPSSPKDIVEIFSDEPARSTPPSSPGLQISSPPRPRRRPMFSFLKRKQKPEPLAKQPLSERSQNVASPPKPPPTKKRLVQMQLDLVAEVSKTCKVCGMGYVPSHAQDAALHRKFHALNVGGVDISNTLCRRLEQNQVWSGGDRSFIAVVSRKDVPSLRNKASEVLKVVNTELGAVPIPDEVLWSQIRNSIAANAQAQGPGEQRAQHPKQGTAEHSASDRFKAYLFVKGQKCVGACLAERIQEAFRVLGQDDALDRTGQHPADADSSSISISAASAPAILGISRIWASNLHRKRGVATRLLDSARSDFLYGMTVDKADVAFSQPTESGGQLARKWFGERAGWLVYID
ncbi:sister chromatid cohesion acetyltransferas-like protein Eco1 [Lentithecium fluviatile CBS 122367]|uniref:Sister chromatid cohesion acetyltransferas-like protein Eco1 n=1 Tax=Lentithecium fluviatile CBS 122367 TaxID=1168545 RepID=A0A6G1J5U9_9PLEO|nr:sister chromatid cohesion acetyltransferas-like protein Eco1 [Lentithecium fluviatile CBS 122367]